MVVHVWHRLMPGQTERVVAGLVLLCAFGCGIFMSMRTTEEYAIDSHSGLQGKFSKANRMNINRSRHLDLLLREPVNGPFDTTTAAPKHSEVNSEADMEEDQQRQSAAELSQPGAPKLHEISSEVDIKDEQQAQSTAELSQPGASKLHEVSSEVDIKDEQQPQSTAELSHPGASKLVVEGMQLLPPVETDRVAEARKEALDKEVSDDEDLGSSCPDETDCRCKVLSRIFYLHHQTGKFAQPNVQKRKKDVEEDEDVESPIVYVRETLFESLRSKVESKEDITEDDIWEIFAKDMQSKSEQDLHEFCEEEDIRRDEKMLPFDWDKYDASDETVLATYWKEIGKEKVSFESFEEMIEELKPMKTAQAIIEARDLFGLPKVSMCTKDFLNKMWYQRNLAYVFDMDKWEEVWAKINDKVKSESIWWQNGNANGLADRSFPEEKPAFGLTHKHDENYATQNLRTSIHPINKVMIDFLFQDKTTISEKEFVERLIKASTRLDVSIGTNWIYWANVYWGLQVAVEIGDHGFGDIAFCAFTEWHGVKPSVNHHYIDKQYITGVSPMHHADTPFDPRREGLVIYAQSALKTCSCYKDKTKTGESISSTVVDELIKEAEASPSHWEVPSDFKPCSHAIGRVWPGDLHGSPISMFLSIVKPGSVISDWTRRLRMAAGFRGERPQDKKMCCNRPDSSGQCQEEVRVNCFRRMTEPIELSKVGGKDTEWFETSSPEQPCSLQFVSQEEFRSATWQCALFGGLKDRAGQRIVNRRNELGPRSLGTDVCGSINQESQETILPKSAADKKKAIEKQLEGLTSTWDTNKNISSWRK